MSQQQAVLIEPLDAENYFEPEVFRREQSRIFARHWQYVCHVEKLVKAGDYVIRDIAGVSLIIMREDARTINAFYNVCAHRAARMLEEEGCKKRFSCPYHAWSYNTSGELICAPNAENVPGFDIAAYRLKPVLVEEIHGLVFVNLDLEARPLSAQIPELIFDLRHYAPNLPKLTFVHRTETYLKANWKIAIENYAECYHCELIHKGLVTGVLDFDTYRIDVIGRTQKHFSRAQLGESRAFEFDEAAQAEFVAWWLWPNFSFQSYPGGRVHVWQWTAVDAENTHLTVDWFFPSKQLASWEKLLIEHHAANTFQEDQAVINSVHLGMKSPGYQPGPLMIDDEKSRYSEHAVAAIQQWWREDMQVSEE